MEKIKPTKQELKNKELVELRTVETSIGYEHEDGVIVVRERFYCPSENRYYYREHVHPMPEDAIDKTTLKIPTRCLSEFMVVE